jgi:predicted N-acetyltransferase YhbS
MMHPSHGRCNGLAAVLISALFTGDLQARGTMLMPESGNEVGVATQQDVQGILDLQERNMRDKGGALSVRFAREWFAAAIADRAAIVARSNGRVVGYVVATPLALTKKANDPMLDEMLRVHPGSPGAYNYGPICVAEDHRGRGVALAMFKALKAQFPGREGFTFIRRDNAVSLAVHTKIGMKEVAGFTYGDAAYVVVAYIG